MRTFDAFLSHNSADKPLVKEIGRWLEDEAGLRVWLDEWNLIPGDPWQEGLEAALDSSKSCVVFLGANGIGPWQNHEMRAALASRVKPGGLRVVPVLLPGADRPQNESALPAFLRRLTWVKFGADWKDDRALHLLVCGIRGVPPGRLESTSIEVCPYRGLEVFRPEDRRFFFGRGALVDRLLDHLEGHRFLAVTGPSGSGKSSVVQAGLVPKLADGETLVEILTPREQPLEELAFALRRCYSDGQAPPTEEILSRLQGSADALHLIARELTEAADAKRVVLVVDQFEELFTQTSDDEQRRRFVANLLGAVEKSGPTSVILTLRSDFLGHCTFDPDLNLFVQDHLTQVGPLSPEEIESAIMDPAHLVGLAFEDGLVEAILDDLRGSAGELPLLQHALLELYQKRDGARLTLAAYQKIGRIQGALARRAEEEFANLDQEQQETLRKMFVFCLVKASEGAEDTRRRATREELLAVGTDPQIAESLLAQWLDARLLTTQSDAARSQQLVDVAHEALIRKWPRLAAWMAEGQQESRLVEALRQGAKEWERQGRRPDYLFKGARLTQAKELLSSHSGRWPPLEKSFVAAASRRAFLRLRLVVLGVALALGVAGYLVYDSNESKKEAERRLARHYWDESQTARNEGRQFHSLHFMAEAVASNPDVALRGSQLIDMKTLHPQFALSRVLEHQGGIRGAVFSGDERQILTWSEDSTARLWDAALGQPIGIALQHQGPVRGAVFDGVESRILTWSDDNTARLWDAATGKPIGPALQHQNWVRGAVFNGDESRILTWSDDNTARLWDAATGEPIGPALQHQDRVFGAVFYADDSRILTWSYDNTARLWDVDTGKPVGGALQHQGSVWGAVLNGDESRVLTWSDDNTAQQWDADTGEPIGPTFQHQGSVGGAVLNGDESRLLTWSFDNTARLWDATTGEPIGPALQHQDWVFGAEFNDDESRILTWSRDNTARLWDAVTGEPIGPALQHQGSIRGAALNGDESRILTWSDDNTARLWDAATGEPIGLAFQHQDLVLGAIFYDDGSSILTWSWDRTARLWNATTGEPMGSVLQHQDQVEATAFEGFGSRVLTLSDGGSARLWDVTTGESIGSAFQQQVQVRGAVFYGDESRILTWSWDSTARLWDAITGEPIGPTLKHQHLVLGPMFNGNGNRVLTWRTEDMAQLWDATTGEPIGPTLKHQRVGLGAVFNSNGSCVLTWSADDKAQLWDAATSEPIGAALQHPVHGALIDGNGSRVLTWSFDNKARLWDATTGEPIGAALQHQDRVRGAVFNSDESRILTWSADSTARLWDATTGEPVGPTLKHQGRVYGAVLNGAESRILTWSEDGTARLWDAITGEPIGPTLKHQGPVLGAVFNGNESRILTRSSDNTARLWDAITSEPIGPALRHQNAVKGAAFNADESRILTWSSDGTARLWDVEADIDFPRDSIVLQVQAITGTEFLPLSREIRIIEPQRWRQIRKDWDQLGRSHYKVCRYPRSNLWRRFNLEEAERIRPLK